jgi:phage terminase large subunit
VSPAQLIIKQWRHNPLQFAHDNFKFEPDEWQKDFLERLGGGNNPRRRVGARACTGPGKSAVLAIAGWHRLACFAEPGEHPKGAALSGEGRESLRDTLWAELSKWQQRSPFLKQAFTWTGERIYANDHAETWFLSLRSYAKDANADQIGTALSGIHSHFPFLLLDETGRMPPVVGQKAQQIFTGGVVDGLIAQAGNPTTTSGLLYQSSVLEAQLWDFITITADPDDPKRTPRVDVAHAKQMIELYGRDNPWVMSTILGLFPLTNTNSLFSSDEVEAAMGKHLPETSYNFVQKKIGVDVALYGDDRTVLFPRQGLASFTPVIMRTQEPADISARLIQLKNETQADQVLVDDTGGWGSGVISHARMAGINPLGVQAAGKAMDPRYYNKRAEMWFLMRDWLRSGGVLPNVKELVAELTTTEYTMKDGRLILQPKDLVKKNLGRSPDLADALAQTFALPDSPKRQAYSGGQSSHQSDWNPLG